MQFCAEPGCGVLVDRGRCPTHTNRQRDQIYAALAHRWYRSARWQRLRLEVLQDEPFCRSCLEHGRQVLTVDIDHIRKHEGDPALFFNRANLQGLCKACHAIKTKRGE